uniref:K12 plasmid DNA n=1 Tax=Escherichia coli TaxID=562 RepID=Q47495_ECOLX|nr:unnamed protein product [Escherichia coli K-12]
MDFPSTSIRYFTFPKVDLLFVDGPKRFSKIWRASSAVILCSSMNRFVAAAFSSVAFCSSLNFSIIPCAMSDHILMSCSRFSGGILRKTAVAFRRSHMITAQDS